MSPSEIPQLDEDALKWVIARVEDRLDEQSALVKARDGRAVMMLTTAVVLATLSALVASIALAIPRDTTPVLVASLSALAGFSLSSTFVLLSVRSSRFYISGASPSEFVEALPGHASIAVLRRARLAELQQRMSDNRTMLETRRSLGNWALWTLMATPVVSLLYGWLASG